VKFAEEQDLTGKTFNRTSKVFRSAQAFVYGPKYFKPGHLSFLVMKIIGYSSFRDNAR
jgi:hypothetical protein